MTRLQGELRKEIKAEVDETTKRHPNVSSEDAELLRDGGHGVLNTYEHNDQGLALHW